MYLSKRRYFRDSTIILLLPALLVMGCASRKAKQEILTVRPVENIPQPPESVEYTDPPKKIKDAAPIYPYQAQREGTTGVVWIHVLVDSTGNVADVMIAKESGKNAGFEEAAVTAALQSKWTPAMYEGKPISIWITYRVNFDLK